MCYDILIIEKGGGKKKNAKSRSSAQDTSISTNLNPYNIEPYHISGRIYRNTKTQEERKFFLFGFRMLCLFVQTTR